jgi:glutaredoxin
MAERYVIYTRAATCQWCDKAKELLKSHNIPYTEYVVGRDITKEELQEQFGQHIKTVPQITVDGRLIGGFESLHERLEHVILD